MRLLVFPDGFVSFTKVRLVKKRATVYECNGARKRTPGTFVKKTSKCKLEKETPTLTPGDPGHYR